MTRAYCVGLTGGIGSGKSTVAQCFAALGATVVDTDHIARDLTAAGGAAMPELIRQFGEAFRQADGSLDRRRMRAQVFADAAARRRLEAVLHPLIRMEAAARVAAATSPYVVLVVPLLVESTVYAGLIDRVLVVDCEPEQQLRRAMRRDAMDETQARAILAAQTSREARLAAADDVLDNRGSRPALEAQVRKLHARYLRDAALPR